MSQPIFPTTARWIARVLSFASLIVIGLFFFGGQEGQQISSTEMLGFLFFPVAVVVGFGIAWRWELCGASVSLLGLVGFYVWHFVRTGDWPSGPWFFVFTSPAVGFLLSALCNRQSRKLGMVRSTDEAANHAAGAAANRRKEKFDGI